LRFAQEPGEKIGGRRRQWRIGARYNAIAGQSVERLAALSDRLFAVAMTTLVLDLKCRGHAILTDQALLAASGGWHAAVV
jgi:hypothetical protein